MLALMSLRRDVCRGNLVFCSTHRNLSVHRSNTNHVGVEAGSHPRVVHINYFFPCFPFFLHRKHGQSSSFNMMLGSVFTVKEEFHETFHNLLTCLSCPPLPQGFFSLKELCGALAHRMMYSLPYLSFFSFC